MIPASKKLKRKRILFRAKSPLTAIISSILLVAAILVVLIHYGVHEQVLVLLSWVESQGIWAPLIFILIMALVVVLLVPGVMLTTGAGFVFGVVEGSIVVVLGTTMGAALAFLAARYLFSQRTSRFFLKHARIRLLSEELSLHGWKIVLLTRLIPFFPSKISNYFFGLTPFSFRGYVFGSLFGFIPYSVHNVYLGSIAADIATLGQRHQERSPLEWAVYGLGFLATLVAVLYLNRLARRAL
ncbi:MAG: VTT domain-containing protein, partial [Deltaproteobacteria bacterium]|nr:VTT domain-containing protein [Deltaproteobacteria bacterium]